jgi:hypothetical protein
MGSPQLKLLLNNHVTIFSNLKPGGDISSGPTPALRFPTPPPHTPYKQAANSTFITDHINIVYNAGQDYYRHTVRE